MRVLPIGLTCALAAFSVSGVVIADDTKKGVGRIGTTPSSYTVAKTYYCSSTYGFDESIILNAEGPDCATARATLQEKAGADPCKARHSDSWWNGKSEDTLLFGSKCQ